MQVTSLHIIWLNTCACLLNVAAQEKKVGKQVICGHNYQSNDAELCFGRDIAKGTWESAWKNCRNDNSFLPVFAVTNEAIAYAIVDYIQNTNIKDLTWIGMRRESGLYQWLEPFPGVFSLYDNPYPEGIYWSPGEPVDDCVAFNVSSRKLVTRRCHDGVKLPYICFNKAHPSKLFESPFCSNGSVYSHVTKRCIYRLKEAATFQEAKVKCEELGARLQRSGDSVDVGDEICMSRNDHGWLDTTDNEDCKSLNLCYDVDEIFVTKGYENSTDCNKKLRVICVSNASTEGVSVEIKPSEFQPFKMNELSSKFLWCKVKLNGVTMHVELENSVKFHWIKNGKMLQARRKSLSPSLAFDLLGNRNETFLQGNYQCKVYLPELTEPLVSSPVDFYFSDVSTYLLTIRDAVISYHPVRDDLSRNTRIEDETNVKMERIFYTQKFRSKFPMEVTWTFQDVSLVNNIVVLRVHLFLVWENMDNEINSRTQIDEKEIYESLLNAIRNSGGIEDKETVTLRNVDACFPDTGNTSHLAWKQSLNTKKAKSNPPCLKSDNTFVTRECSANFTDGANWGPVQGTCANKQTEVSTRLNNLFQTGISTENVWNVSKELDNITSFSGPELQPLDVWLVASTLQEISSVPGQDEMIVRRVVETVNNMLEVNVSTMDISRYGQLNATSSIASAMERTVFKASIGDSLKVEYEHVSVSAYNLRQSNTTLELGVAQMSSSAIAVSNGTLKSLYQTDYNNETFSNSDVAIFLPQNLVEARARNTSKDARTSYVVYKRGTLFANSSYLQGSQLYVVAGLVISASISGDPVTNVDPPVQIAFKPIMKHHEHIKNFRCVFWNQSLNNGFGDWSDKGCRLAHSMFERYICYCNHLTTFSILTAYHHVDEVLHEDHGKVLNAITYIGCGLSIMGLLLTLATFVLFRKWRQGLGHQTVCNLSIALLGTQLVFLLGIDNVNWKIGCAATAALLHYFLLATFTWMLVEACLQYLRFVKVIGTYVPRFMRKAAICAWGTPLIIVIIVLSVNYRVYGNDKYCWITGKPFFVAFLLPAGVMMLINIIIFCVIIYSITCGRQKLLRSNQSEYRLAVARLRAAICILVLLGLSWTFGFFAIGKASVVFQYLFCITTTPQGFLIFLFHVVQDPSTRALWSQIVLCKGQQSPVQTFNSNNTRTSRIASVYSVSKPQYSR